DFVLSFFFSSRRRHTSFSRDWSSDVCSSDLSGRRVRRGRSGGLSLHCFKPLRPALRRPLSSGLPTPVACTLLSLWGEARLCAIESGDEDVARTRIRGGAHFPGCGLRPYPGYPLDSPLPLEIGRASCREGV